MIAFGQEILVELVELPPLKDLERDWLELEASSNSSFYTSWSWIGCWLACLPKHIKPRLLRAIRAGKPVAMGLLVSHNYLRHGLIPVKSLSLNTTGDPYYDEITIEHNGFLLDCTLQHEIVPQLYKYLASVTSDWDELHLDGVTGILCSQIPAFIGLKVQRQQKCNYYVDLEKVRAAAGDYLSLLGQNTRYNIRRSIREYENKGQITLTVAENIDEACDFLARLKRLHQAYWRSRGFDGAFANDFFESFHDRLIRTNFDSGEIQLIRVNVGDQALGYLYNFILRGHVYNYQTGFDYFICEKKNRPGLVAHNLAIVYNTIKGHRVYDFLAGESQYKEMLGTCSCGMEWIVLQCDRLKFRLEENLRQMKRLISG
jgi:hypothetical protein